MFFLLRLLLTQETERRVLGTLRLSPGDTAISLGGAGAWTADQPKPHLGLGQEYQALGWAVRTSPPLNQDGGDRTSVEGLPSSGCAAGRGVPARGMCYHVHFAREKPSLRRGRAGCSRARIGAEMDRLEGRQETVNAALGQGPRRSTRMTC